MTSKFVAHPEEDYIAHDLGHSPNILHSTTFQTIYYPKILHQLTIVG
jgi:hypothetical protein